MPEISNPNYTLWLIDDHPPLHHLVMAALEDIQFAGTLVSIYSLMEARESIKLAMEAAVYPDLVLLDINLKGEDGLDFLLEVSGAYPRLPFPVSIFSSSDRMEEMIRAYEVGAHSYLVKPFHFEQMLVSLRGALAFFLSRNYRHTPDSI